MDQPNILSEEKVTLVKTVIEIQAISISIESMLLLMVDDEIDNDWLESILFFTQQQKSIVKSIVPVNDHMLSCILTPIATYCRAIESVSMRAIYDNSQYYTIIEATLSLIGKQLYYIEKFLSFVAEL